MRVTVWSQALGTESVRLFVYILFIMLSSQSVTIPFRAFRTSQITDCSHHKGDRHKLVSRHVYSINTKVIAIHKWMSAVVVATPRGES